MAMLRFALFVVCALIVIAPFDAVAQNGRATDAFEDDASRDLVMTYLEARAARRAERESYQALFRTRQRVGFLIPNQWAWRDRTLFHKEVAVYLDFNPDNPRPATLVGKTRGAPMIGDRLIDNPAWFGKFGFDPESDSPSVFGLVSFSLASISRDVPLTTVPKRRLAGFDSTWADPLSPGAMDHYRYRMGRTPDPSDTTMRDLEIVEVRSREGGTSELVGGIWFNKKTGQPVRALYRPRGRWKVRAGFAGFARAIPVVPKNALASVDFFAIEYGYEEPHRIVGAKLDGAMFWFYDQAILPVIMEWDLDWDESYDSPTAIRAFEDADGGITKEADGQWAMGPDTTYGATWLTPPPIEAGSGLKAPSRDLQPFIRELDWIAGRPPPQGLGRTLSSAIAGVRFNQVQGVNLTVRYPIYVGPRSTVNLATSFGTSSFRPTAEIEYRKESRPRYWNVEAYSRLKDANWTENVNGIFSSLTAILTGYDDGIYYLARGFSAGVGVHALPLSGRFEAFIEKQSTAEKTEMYSLFGPPDVPPPPLDADEGTVGGLRGGISFQFGDDPQKRVVIVRFIGEAATGDFDYVTFGTINDLVRPLFWHLDGALRLWLGFARGNIPAQALWYLGGDKTIRGYAANSASGETAYVLRAEIGTDLPLLRLVLFGDVGWAASPGDLFDAEPLIGVGPGLSFFDGVVRIDFGTGLNRSGTFRVSFSTSGVF